MKCKINVSTKTLARILSKYHKLLFSKLIIPPNIDLIKIYGPQGLPKYGIYDKLLEIWSDNKFDSLFKQKRIVLYKQDILWASVEFRISVVYICKFYKRPNSF